MVINGSGESTVGGRKTRPGRQFFGLNQPWSAKSKLGKLRDINLPAAFQTKGDPSGKSKERGGVSIDSGKEQKTGKTQ